MLLAPSSVSSFANTSSSPWKVLATNYSIEETYTLLRLFQSHGVDMLLTGHSHSREVTLYDELTCIIVDSMTDSDTKPAYLVATMGEKIDYDFIPITKR